MNHSTYYKKNSNKIPTVRAIGRHDNTVNLIVINRTKSLLCSHYPNVIGQFCAISKNYTRKKKSFEFNIQQHEEKKKKKETFFLSPLFFLFGKWGFLYRTFFFLYNKLCWVDLSINYYKFSTFNKNIFLGMGLNELLLYISNLWRSWTLNKYISTLIPQKYLPQQVKLFKYSNVCDVTDHLNSYIKFIIDLMFLFCKYSTIGELW